MVIGAHLYDDHARHRGSMDVLP